MQRTAATNILSPLLLLCGLAGPATAEEVDPDLDRWSSSVSLGFDLLMEDIHGTMDSNFEPRNNAQDQADTGVRGVGRAFFANPMFGLDAQLTAPSWTPLPGRPRLFIGAGVRYAQNIPHVIAKSGDKPEALPPESEYFTFVNFRNGPRQPVLPTVEDGKINPECIQCAARSVPGQGIRLSAGFAHFYWQAEAGVVFTIPLEMRSLLIKPGIGYYQQRVQMEGVAHRVFRADGPVPNQPPFGEFSTVELDVSVEDTFHSLGPKIALELDAVRFKSMGQRFGASIYLDAGVYWLLGDRETNGFAIEETANDGTKWARYHMEIDKLSFRVGVGFRLTWYPRWHVGNGGSFVPK